VDALALQLLLSDRRRTVASSRIARETYSAGAIDAFLKSHRLQRSDVLVGVSLSVRLGVLPQLRTHLGKAALCGGEW
jgi:hypothetical protein